MKNLRKKWLLPIAVFAIAIAGAFASNVEKPKDAVWVAGFIDHPTPCKVQVDCSLTNGPACTSGGLTAKRMNAGNTRCDLPAFQYIP
ncbi:MAG: hypothetical protein JJE55_15090 [Flavobacteriaceae bacterium]|nr:hypothetical protein [Flavobacteriaceae bacterium]